MTQYYTYVYYDKAVPIYVGKGSKRRAYTHFRGYSRDVNLHLHNTIQKMLREQNEPIIKIINVECEAEAFELEKFLIAEIGRRDLDTGPLLNLTDGGDGASGRKMTEETKAKRKQTMAKNGTFSPPPKMTSAAAKKAGATRIKNGTNHRPNSGLNSEQARKAVETRRKNGTLVRSAATKLKIKEAMVRRLAA